MQLNPKTTALVLIDLQQSGVLAMPMAPHTAAAVYDRSMRLASRFRSAGAPVVRVRVSFFPGPHRCAPICSRSADQLHLSAFRLG